MKCAAFGCNKVPGANGLFCTGDWRRLPRDLRAPGKSQEAIIYLGRKDGYIVDAEPRRRATLTEAEGRESV